MRKTTVLFILLIFLANFLFAQTKFVNGFNNGYKKRFCHDKGVSCIEPIPPIAPNPKIGESSNNYNDGYNRGFQLGLNAGKSNDSGNGYKTSKPKYVDDVIYQAPVNEKIKALKAMDRKQNFNLSFGKKLKSRIKILKGEINDTLIEKGFKDILESISFYEEPKYVNLAEKEFRKIDNYLDEISTFSDTSKTKDILTEKNPNKTYYLKTKTELRKGPNEDYQKVLNTRATKAFKRDVYFKIGTYGDEVIIEEEKDGWIKIKKQSDDEYFRYRGWVKSEYVLRN